MKKIWKVLLIVVALLVISFTIASACPPKPVCQEGEITVEEAKLVDTTIIKSRYGFWTLGGWVWRDWKVVDSCNAGWFRVGWDLKYRECKTITTSDWTSPVCRVPNEGCMDETALNYDELAEIDNPEMCEYAEVKQGCAFTMYVLQGNGTCSLTRNYGLEDIPGKIPSRFVQDGKLTAYGQGLCNQCRTTPFKYSGEWTTTCDIPCVDCN